MFTTQNGSDCDVIKLYTDRIEAFFFFEHRLISDILSFGYSIKIFCR